MIKTLHICSQQHRHAGPSPGSGAAALKFCLVLFLTAGGIQVQSTAQELFAGREDSSFSAQMKGGQAVIRLLDLPASLENNRALFNRSIGGIGGSSFQTEIATPEQTWRQRLRAAPARQFAGTTDFTTGEPSTEFPSTEKFLRISEEHFRTPSYFKVQESRQPSTETSLELIGRERRKGLLEDIAPTLELKP
jgi:hypothetical protein